jgi:hypothetical protein
LQRLDGTLLRSATDLVAFLDCEHRTARDLAHVDAPAETAPDDDHATLISNGRIDGKACVALATKRLARGDRLSACRIRVDGR